MSFTKSVITLSKVGSAPLLARKNLPLLLLVPCSNFASVTDSSAILEVITPSAASSVEPTAPAAILAAVTESFCNIAVVTVLLLGVPMFTVLPKTTA